MDADVAVDAVIFDMDGVIVDSEQYWHEEQKRILETAAPDADVDFDEVRGMNVLDQYDHLTEQYEPTVTRDGYFDLYDEKAEAVYTEKAELMSGFHDLITMLRGKVKLAVCSSSFRHWISMVLDRFDLTDTFDTVVSAEDIDGPSKPDPHIYRHTADELGVEPARCVVVEDSAHGVTAATEAGMYCIGYCTDPEREDAISHADTVVYGLVELRETLEALVS